MIIFAADNSYHIKGVILDQLNQEPLIGANVFITNIDDSTHTFLTTDKSGWFYSVELPSGTYAMKVTYIGYETYQAEVEVISKDLDLGLLCLNHQPIQMSAIEVTGKIPITIQNGDTLVYNASSIAIAQNASARDLILKMPACYETGGKILINGEFVDNVLLEGDDFFKNNPNIALGSIPAEMIDKIEVYEKNNDAINNLSGNDNPKKAINIILKPNKNKGLVGDVYYAVGENSINQLGATINSLGKINRITANAKIYNHVNSNDNPNETVKSNSGSGIADIREIQIHSLFKPTKKMKISNGYNINHKDETNENELSRYYQLGTDQEYFKTSNSNNLSLIHNLVTKINYKLSDKDEIEILSMININNSEQTISSLSNTYLEGSNISQTENNNESSENMMYINGGLSYKHHFIKNKRSMLFTINRSSNDLDYNNTQDYEVITEDTTASYNYISDSKNQNQNILALVKFEENFGKMGKVALGTIFGNSTGDNKKETYRYSDITSGYSDLDSSLSSDLDNEQFHKTLMLVYSNTIEKLNLKCQLDYKNSEVDYFQQIPTLYTSNRSYYNWLPYISANYKFNKKKSLKLSYRIDNNLPQSNQLNEVLDNDDPDYLEMGNASLKQQTDHKIMLTYKSNKALKNKNLTAKFNYFFSNNYIGYKTIFAGSDGESYNGIEISPGGQLTIPVNMSGYTDFDSKISYGFPMDFIKSNMLININSGYVKTPAYLNDNQYFYEKTTGEAALILTSNISDKISFKITNIANISRSQYDDDSLVDNIQVNQYSNLDLEWHFGRGFDIQTSLNYQNQNNSTTDIDNSSLLWNMSFGKALFKNQQGDLRLFIYDILKDNKSISQNYSDTYFEERKSLTLDRYFMLIFNYKIKNYKQ